MFIYQNSEGVKPKYQLTDTNSKSDFICCIRMPSLCLESFPQRIAYRCIERFIALMAFIVKLSNDLLCTHIFSLFKVRLPSSSSSSNTSHLQNPSRIRYQDLQLLTSEVYHISCSCDKIAWRYEGISTRGGYQGIISQM